MKGWWRNGDRWKAIKPVPLQLLFSQEWSQIQRMFRRSVPPTQADVSWQNATSPSALLAHVLWPVSVETGVSYPTGCHLCAHSPPSGSVVLVHLPRGASLLYNPLCIVFCVRMCRECRHFSDTTHLPWQTVTWPSVQVYFSSYMC